MPAGGLLLAGVTALGSAGYKAYTASEQARVARRLRREDITPEGQRRNLALAQLAAASGRMPGQDAAEAQINQSTEATLQGARAGATGGGSVLAALGRANGQRLGALANLGTRVQQFQQQARAQLAAANDKQAAYDTESTNQFNNTKSSLIQASAENNMSAISDVANVGAFVGGGLADAKLAKAGVGATAAVPAVAPVPTVGQTIRQGVGEVSNPAAIPAGMRRYYLNSSRAGVRRRAAAGYPDPLGGWQQ